MSFTPVVQRPRAEHGHLSTSSEALDWVLAVVGDENREGCRDWPGSRTPKGYGQMGYQGRTRQVGHVVLELSGRPRPVGAQQLHSPQMPRSGTLRPVARGSHAENHAESVAKGRSSRGEHRPLAKLTESAVREIRTSSATLAALAEKFGVGVPTVQKARVGETWKHVERVDETGTVGIMIEDGQVVAGAA